jgi:hypothetical protein
MFTYTYIGAILLCNRGRRGRDRVVVEFTTTSAISAYRHYRCNITLCDKVCQ